MFWHHGLKENKSSFTATDHLSTKPTKQKTEKMQSYLHHLQYQKGRNGHTALVRNLWFADTFEKAKHKRETGKEMSKVETVVEAQNVQS